MYTETEDRLDKLEALLGKFILHTDILMDRMDEDRRKMNRKWGELANKMGTLAEDMVAPNITRIVRGYFGCAGMDFFGVRIKKRNQRDITKTREFDVIAICEDILLINETKSTPKIDYINDFIETLGEIHDYFPEYKKKKIIPVFSSLYIPEDIVKYLTKRNIYAMGLRDDTMELLNFAELKKKK